MADKWLTIDIRGVKEMERVLKLLPSRISERVVQNALRAGGRVFKRAIEANAPVRSGFLADHILVRSVPKSKRLWPGHVRIGPSSRAFHGLFNEFGTEDMPPQPFMRPAFDTAAGEALAKTGDSLGRGIERAAKRLAGPLAKSGLKRR